MQLFCLLFFLVTRSCSIMIMETSSSQEIPEISEFQMTPQNTNRLSLLDVSNGSTILNETVVSPAHSIYPDVEDEDDVDLEANAVSPIDHIHIPTLMSSPMLPSAHLKIDQPTIEAEGPHITPKASNVQLKSDFLKRPRFVTRRSLLNEPISFLSTTTSSASSTQSLSLVEDDVTSVSIETQAEGRPGRIQANPVSNTISGRRRFLDSRPKAARILGGSLRTLATEQGGIPIRALSSPIYSQPSDATVIPPLRSSAITDKNLASLTSSEIDNADLLQPLYVHPSRTDTLTHRFKNTPAKLSKKPKFLPESFHMPKSGGSFTRESVISTPYPSSGFAYLQPSKPVINADLDRNDGFSESKHLISSLKIPVLVRNCNNYISAVGKVELSGSRFEKDVEGVKDDLELVKSIFKEYRRLQGWRVIVSARYLTGIRIVLKSHTRGFSAADMEYGCTSNENYPEHAAVFMENCYPAPRVDSCTSSRVAKVISSKQDIEETLGLLLRRPSLGADSQICIAELRRLVLETTLSNRSGNHRGTLSFETVVGWNRLKIGIVATGTMTASMLVTMLWILLGVNQEVSIIDKVFTPVIKPGEWTTNNARGDWNGVGTRVEGGAALGLLVLLLGWSWMILWMALSWLVN